MRAFYEALGIELPGWAHTEAPVRCFADPDAHQHEDSDPSCSVNLESGAFNCHGCGARGGAYDAALARDRSPREAMNLLVAFGLAEHRRRDTPGRAPRVPTARRSSRAAVTPVRLAVGADEVQRWADALQRSPSLLARLGRERGWTRGALAGLEVGFDGDRITVPIWRTPAPGDAIRRQRAELQGLLRLRVDGSQRPKVLAVTGTRLGLMPLTAWMRGRQLLLVEGPSDLLAARSAGMPAIAVPGANAWRSEWASAFDGRSVVVVMDCDRPGRQAAARIASDLQRRGIETGVADLAPRRQDGYDLSDWLREGHSPAQLLHT
ncbi:MAG: toprim domain-containing protein, partial [Solirubrobacteraceae bacterium]